MSAKSTEVLTLATEGARVPLAGFPKIRKGGVYGLMYARDPDSLRFELLRHLASQSTAEAAILHRSPASAPDHRLSGSSAGA